MLSIITNPITISVIVMCALCLLKLNVILSLLVAAIVGGLTAGQGIDTIMKTLLAGFNSNAENSLAYLLLGTFAAALEFTGLAALLAKKVTVAVKGSRAALLATLCICACISGTLITVHIAFIPILVPPLLHLMNELRIDRRAAATALGFGLKAMYITIPIGYGIIFHSIIASNMTENGWPIAMSDVWKHNWILGIGMLAGLFISQYVYRKPRDYKDIDIELDHTYDNLKMGHAQWVSLVAVVVTVVAQLWTGMMPYGALAGIFVLIVGGAIKLDKTDFITSEGIKLMGMIAFIMLIAGGYAGVIKSTGAVKTLIEDTLAILGTNKAVIAIVLILIGLVITMGIGTSFGTVPVIALLYVPLMQKTGFSLGACCCLIACAAALGDAGSPASDTTLGPTAGLNADGQHDHIRDTCIPQFLCYNIPLAIAGFIGALVL
ncbi:MAG: sodium:proton antiporter [Acidaminococcus sp.]|jgi:predicted histidine transporter YuiF (NhaC family)|nr:sodium:proton antiporter [Acidaminococcus sp.]